MDDDLLTQLAAGDEAAFRCAYERFGPALFRTAVRLLGDRQAAEDAVQDVFVALVRGRAGLGRVTNLRAYLFVALRHAAATTWRRARPATMAALDPAGLADAPAPEPAEELWAAVQRLPREQREVLAMKIQGELTFREIAEVCGISPNTAASRYRYALERLRALLEGRTR